MTKEQAIKLAGSQVELARILGISKGAVSQWRVIPALRIYQLKELEIEAKKAWATCDVIMVPSAPNHPTMEDLKNHPISKNSELGMYTNYVNLMRLCAVAVPAGFTDQGLPFGVTFIAQEGSDNALLKLASQWQILFGFRDSMVTSTMVAGKFLMKDRKLMTLDKEEIFRKAYNLSKDVWLRYQRQFQH